MLGHLWAAAAWLEEQCQRRCVPCLEVFASCKGVSILFLHSSSSLPSTLALFFRYFLMQLAVPDNFFHLSNSKIRGFLKWQAYFQL